MNVVGRAGPLFEIFKLFLLIEFDLPKIKFPTIVGP
jgi:hypothetical protein